MDGGSRDTDAAVRLELVSVYKVKQSVARQLLYRLLESRPPESNISHREMPAWSDHCAFLASRPYEAWYIIQTKHHLLGAIYLAKDDSWGVSLLPEHRGKGYGSAAFRELARLHPRKRYVANLAPGNEASKRMMEGLGFKMVQHTYALDMDALYDFQGYAGEAAEA